MQSRCFRGVLPHLPSLAIYPRRCSSWTVLELRGYVEIAWFVSRPLVIVFRLVMIGYRPLMSSESAVWIGLWMSDTIRADVVAHARK